MLQHLDNNVEEDVLKILRGIVKMEPNVTLCITRSLEKTVGCSIGMAGADPNIKR